MATPDQTLDAMIQTFDKAYPGTARGMQRLFEAAPTLKTQMLRAIDAGQLEGFDPISNQSRREQRIGAYHPETRRIEISEGLLQLAADSPPTANRVLAILGHEVEHAVDRQAMSEDHRRFLDAARTIAEGPSPHDYTRLIRERVDTLRGYEARHELAAFNLVAAKIAKENPGASRDELYGKLHDATALMQPYFERDGETSPPRYRPREGIVFNADFQVEPTPDNVAAFGRHFYDANDYPERYGKDALAKIGLIEEMTQASARAADPASVAPEVRVELAALGLRGATLPPGFTDSSLPPGRKIHGASWEDPLPAHLPPRGSAPGAVRSPLHGQARDALDALGVAAGLPSDDAKDAVAAAIALRVQGEGWRSIDAILPSRDGTGLIAVQGDPSTPQAKTCYCDREDALRQPLAQSLARLQGDGEAPAPVPAQTPTGPVR